MLLAFRRLLHIARDVWYRFKSELFSLSAMSRGTAPPVVYRALSFPLVVRVTACRHSTTLPGLRSRSTLWTLQDCIWPAKPRPISPRNPILARPPSVGPSSLPRCHRRRGSQMLETSSPRPPSRFHPALARNRVIPRVRFPPHPALSIPRVPSPRLVHTSRPGCHPTATPVAIWT